MELDELRRQWQQPPAEPAPDVAALLQARPSGLVEKMRRNAWLETGLNGLMAFLGLALLARGQETLWRAYGGFMLLLAVGFFYYYYRKLSLLRRMAHAETEVRRHLGALCTGLRGLLRFYYRITVAMVPTILLCFYCGLFGFLYGGARVAGKPVPWDMLAAMGGILLVTGGLLQIGLVYFTRWYLQKLYGRHLDRLEASLRELDEPAQG